MPPSPFDLPRRPAQSSLLSTLPRTRRPLSVGDPLHFFYTTPFIPSKFIAASRCPEAAIFFLYKEGTCVPVFRTFPSLNPFPSLFWYRLGLARRLSLARSLRTSFLVRDVFFFSLWLLSAGDCPSAERRPRFLETNWAPIPNLPNFGRFFSCCPHNFS